MASFTQLVIDGLYLPKTSHDKYRCYPAQLGEQIEMISGRRVWEIRGNVQMIEYAYDYMGNDMMRRALTILRSGKSFPVLYLPDDGDALQSGVFMTESLTSPSMAFARNGVAYWHNFAFTLREVKPHD